MGRHWAQGQVWELHGCRYVTGAAGRDRKRSRQGMDLDEAAFYHLQMTTRQKTWYSAYQNTLRMWWTHFILQLSGEPGQSSVCKSSNKVSAAALGLVFCMMSKQSKTKKQIARPEYDETEEWKSWLKHFPNATQRNRWRKKWNDSSLLLCTYCNTQH